MYRLKQREIQRAQPIFKPIVTYGKVQPAPTKKVWSRKSKYAQIVEKCGCFVEGFKYFQLYMATCCNHCYIYLVKNSLTLIEHLFWFILIAISHYYCITIALQSIERFSSKNSYMGIERDYFSWNTTLPSITICPLNRLNDTMFDEYCQSNGIKGENKADFWDLMEHLANSTYFNFQDIPLHKSLDSTLDQLKLTPDKYMALIFNLTRNNLTYDDGPPKRIRSIDNNEDIRTRQVLTEYGLCYMTNYLLDDRYTSDYLIFGKFPEPNPHAIKNNVKPLQRGSYTDKYIDFTFLGFGSDSIDIYAHSPFEVMKVDNNYGYTQENVYFEPTITEITTQTDFETDANIRQRNCRFRHESNLTHYPVYTKNICMQECRLRLVYDICKCIPHFYPNRLSKPKRVCDYKTLKQCLPQHESYFLKLYRKRNNSNELDVAPCFCEQNCEGSVISLKISAFKNSRSLYGSLGAVMSMKEWPTVRYKREIYLTFTDLLVYIGGTAGLFLGISVLGAIEAIYFFTMRLLFHLLGYKI